MHSLRLVPTFALIAATAFGLFAAPAVRAETSLGQFRDWTARSYKDGKTDVCNMFAKPSKDEGDYTQRGDITAFITHRPANKSWNVVAFDMGYPTQDGGVVVVEIGSDKFELFTKGSLAFSYPEDDAKIVAAMRKGSGMIVRGKSQRGTDTTDTYSLSGFTAAHNAINQACKAPAVS